MVQDGSNINLSYEALQSALTSAPVVTAGDQPTQTTTLTTATAKQNSPDKKPNNKQKKV